jgi:hypothetical protein
MKICGSYVYQRFVAILKEPIGDLVKDVGHVI